MGYIGRAPVGAPLEADDIADGAILQQHIAPSVVIAPKLFISGLVPSQAADTEHDIAISTGVARDVADTWSMSLSASLTKQIDAAFAEGTGVGGMFTGSVAADTWYYMHLIRKTLDGTIDVGFDTSSVAANIPSGWSSYRPIAAIRTDASSNVLGFVCLESSGGLYLQWKSPTLDINLTNTLTTTARLDTIKVPSAFKVLARLHVRIADGAFAHAYLSDPDVDDLATSSTTAPLSSIAMPQNANFSGYEQLEIMTSGGQIRARGSALIDTYQVVTLGFEWSRK